MYDLIIIGAGTAGMQAYKEAVKQTQNLLIINEGPWDTTCARVGCMPSKVLISSANRLYQSQNIHQVGINTQSSFDTSEVMTHVRTLRDHFTSATVASVEKWPEQHKICGRAVFLDQNTVEVNGQQYQAKSFILAVGSTPIVNSDWKAVLQDRFVTSDQIFEIPTLPKSLAVVGSGVIAIELAQAFARLNVDVTVFARSRRVGSLTSPKLQPLAQKLIAEDLNIHFETLPKAVKRTDAGVEIQFDLNGEQQNQCFDYLLNATSRSSNLASLKLTAIHTDFADIKNLPVNSKTKQLADLPIFIAGDALTNTPVQHEAAHEGKYLVANCLNYPQVEPVKTLTPLNIMFSSPEMATAGLSYKQLKAQNSYFVTGYVSYAEQGRATVLGENAGGAEIYVEHSSGKILGAEILAPQGEHLAHLLCWMISQQATVDGLLAMPFYHPTLEEGLRTALVDAKKQLN